MSFSAQKSLSGMSDPAVSSIRKIFPAGISCGFIRIKYWTKFLAVKHELLLLIKLMGDKVADWTSHFIDADQKCTSHGQCDKNVQNHFNPLQ